MAVQFSSKLIDRECMVPIIDYRDGTEVWVRGTVIALFEGKNWAHLTRIELIDGPTRGRVVTREIGHLYFGDSEEVPPRED